MPEKGINLLSKDQYLSEVEIKRIISIFSQMGVSKIRFTGGEPLLREDITELIRYAKNQCKIDQVHLTTNGILLNKYIEQLSNVGLSGINISLDSLKPQRFEKISRRDKLYQVLDNILLVQESTIPSLKINVVFMKGFNDDELLDFVEFTKTNNLTVRFIELMPFDAHQVWKTGKFYKSADIVNDLKHKIEHLRLITGSNTEHYIFQVDGYLGKIAIIPSYSRNLCINCNRIRITADGSLRNCLYSKEEKSLRDLIRKGASDQELKEVIWDSFLTKRKDGWEAQRVKGNIRESMTQIGG
jgi:cyclic pyranopterin phosphate synthase